MKRNTHIYLAWKAIELMEESISNTVDEKGKYLEKTKKGDERKAAKSLQHMLQYYNKLIIEAAWAPDDVLKDMRPYHMFKLFTEDESFELNEWEEKLDDMPQFERDGLTYYRFSGGLPYRVDHIAQDIISMSKLRDFNDHFSLEQIMYHYLLMSHYVVDAHVPVHCDLRDDPPKKNDGSDKPKGKYMKKTAHGDLEMLWEKGVNHVAVKEKIIPKTLAEEGKKKTAYTELVTFDLEDCNKKGKEVKVPTISKGGLMDFMIDVCIESKKRSQQLFPVDNPKERNDAILPDMTREIFSTCIADLIAIWRYIRTYCQAEEE